MAPRNESVELLVDVLQGAADPDVLDAILLDAVHQTCGGGAQALFRLDARGELGTGAWRGDRELLPSRAAIRDGLRAGRVDIHAGPERGVSPPAWVRRVGPDLVLVLARAPDSSAGSAIDVLLDCWSRDARSRAHPDDRVPAALPASGADVELRKLAHDMRNHVAGLLTTQAVRRTLALELDDAQRLHYDGVVERECRRAGELLAHALGLREPRAAELGASGAELALALRDTVHSERPAFDDAAVDLEAHVDCAGDAWRYPISEVELGRLVRNLLVNAREACSPPSAGSRPDAGRARVRLECSIGAGQSGEIFVSVVDEGPGIEPSLLSSLFEPGTSTRSSHSGPSSQRGLGLACVREIAERSGGFVTSKNRSGGGAAFEVRIPRIAEHVER